MTIQSGTLPLDPTPPDPTLPYSALPAEGNSFAGQIVKSTVGRANARFALGWIFILGLLSVLAPFLANSNPYLLKTGGHWSSPLVASLSPIDWTLILSLAAVPLILRSGRTRLWVRLSATAAAVALLAVGFGFLVPESRNIDYSRFREMAAAGKVQFALPAPIPYSASDRQIDKVSENELPPGRDHWLGTEGNAGDVASRLLHACRTAMSIGLVSTGIAIVIGIVVGGLMGFFAGAVDILCMRLIEIFEAVPTLFLIITLIAFFPGENYRLLMVMAVIGVTGWTGYARYLRAEFLKLRNMDFVHAAVASGLSTPTVVFRHILPNGINPVVTAASFSIAGAVVAESTLSFLGLGVIDQPSWGGLLTQSLGEGGQFHWWLAVFPGIAIFLTVLSYNLLGEAVADALDPKRR